MQPEEIEQTIQKLQKSTDCMFFVPKMGNGVALNDATGNTRAVLYVDPSGAPHLLLNDAEGHSLVSLPDATKQPKPQE